MCDRISSMSAGKQNESAVKARINFINPAGSSVKIDLTSESDMPIQVEISQEEFARLKPLKGENVFVSPKDITFCEYDI
jgi:hypothetical protein